MSMNLAYRPLTIDDLPLRAKWLADPEVNRYLGTRVRDGLDLEFHQKWFAGYLADEEAGKRKIFTVLDNATAIGQVGLTDINLEDKNAGLYIAIGEAEYRGRGLSQVLMKYICYYGFDVLKLHKITLEVHADNIAGVKAYTKFGFVEEGRLRENVFYDGLFRDEIVIAIFESTRKSAE